MSEQITESADFDRDLKSRGACGAVPQVPGAPPSPRVLCEVRVGIFARPTPDTTLKICSLWKGSASAQPKNPQTRRGF